MFAADNDHHLPRRETPLPNAGLEKARAAAAEVNGGVMSPVFGDGDPGTDWNDYARQHGLGAAREAIEAFLQQHGITMPDPAKVPTPRSGEAEASPRVTTQAQRDAARERMGQAPRTPQTDAQRDAQRAQQAVHDAQRASQRQQQQQQQHGSGHGAGRS